MRLQRKLLNKRSSFDSKGKEKPWNCNDECNGCSFYFALKLSLWQMPRSSTGHKKGQKSMFFKWKVIKHCVLLNKLCLDLTSACAQSILMELQTNKNSNTNTVAITNSKKLDTNTNIRSWWKGSGARRNCSFIEINFSLSLLFYLCQQHYLGGARKTRKLSSLKWKTILQKKLNHHLPEKNTNLIFQ